MSNTLNKTKKVAFCGIISALSIVVLLLAYFPYLTYALPAIAGAFFVIVVAHLGVKWAFLTYLVTSVLAFVGVEKEAMLIFVCFFGFYPIIKYLFEKMNKPIIEYILKFLVFNICVVLFYYLSTYIFGISVEDFTSGLKYATLILLVAANITFLVYDIALNRVIALYFNRFHNKLGKFLR